MIPNCICLGHAMKEFMLTCAKRISLSSRKRCFVVDKRLQNHLCDRTQHTRFYLCIRYRRLNRVVAKHAPSQTLAMQNKMLSEHIRFSVQKETKRNESTTHSPTRCYMLPMLRDTVSYYNENTSRKDGLYDQ